MNANFSFGDQSTRPSSGVSVSSARPFISACMLTLALTGNVFATENVPHRPFALWADVPEKNQFVVGLVYEESEAYHIWASGQYHNVTVIAGGEHYGIDINQGYVALQYGMTEKWAGDFNVGFTTVGWRYFNTNGGIESTTGLMDVSFGLRYQIFNEATANSPWIPTVTFRAGAVIPGSYSQHFPFAPGTRSAAIEPEILFRKHFGWPGLGVYGDALFRWNHTTGNDLYIIGIGFFQKIARWELDVGYRHLQTITGTDVVLNGHDLFYPRDPREINDGIEAGFSYTSLRHHVRYGFHSRTIVDGNNTDGKFWLGVSIDVPFGGKREP